MDVVCPSLKTGATVFERGAKACAGGSFAITKAVATLRVSVWRPIRFGRELHYVARDSPGSATAAPFDLPSQFTRDRLAEQIYTWSPAEDVWGGLHDENARSRLKEILMKNFDPALSPAERGLDKLATFLDSLEQVLQKPGATAWMTTSEQALESSSGEVFFRMSPTLALAMQLRWILESFRHVPGLSLIVR